MNIVAGHRHVHGHSHLERWGWKSESIGRIEFRGRQLDKY